MRTSGHRTARNTGREASAGRLVAEVCQQHDWTLAELAAAVRVTPRAVQSWKTSLSDRRTAQLEALLATPSHRVDVCVVRRQLGWTQSQLGKRFDTSARTVARWEAGHLRVPAAIRDQLATLMAEAPNPARSARERLGDTQLELARRLGKSGALISRWENGLTSVPTVSERALRDLVADVETTPSPEWIRHRREGRGLTQRQLAKRLDCQPARVSEWESGKRPVPGEMRVRLRRELGGAKAKTASRDAEVLELVRRKPGLSLPQLLEHFPAHDAGAAQGALTRHLLAKRLFRAKGIVRDRIGRPRWVWRHYPRPQADERVSSITTGAWLGVQLEKTDWTQVSLAAELGVSREAVRYWLQRQCKQIPAGRQGDVIRALHREAPERRLCTAGEPSALPDLRKRRVAVGLTQPALAERLGVEQSTVSAYERGTVRVSQARAAKIRDVLQEAAAERVTGEELRAGRVGAGWTQGDLAARLGVRRGRVRGWESARTPVPCNRWAQIRSVLEAAPPAVTGEPMSDLRLRRDALGWSQRQLADRLGVWQADVSRWERGAPVPPAIRETLVRELETGVPATDPADARRAAIVAVVSDEPGLSGRLVMPRVGGSWNEVRAALEALKAAGELHERTTRYVDGAGRERSRPGLYPGPASASPAPKLSGAEIVRRREQLLWSQAELARRVGVEQAIVWRWEHGVTSPDPSRVTRLEQMFAAGWEEIVGGRRDRLEALEELLAPARDRLGLSLSEMARRLDVDRGTYAAWEAGRRPVSTGRRRGVLAALTQLEHAAEPGDVVVTGGLRESPGNVLGELQENCRNSPGAAAKKSRMPV